MIFFDRRLFLPLLFKEAGVFWKGKHGICRTIISWFFWSHCATNIGNVPNLYNNFGPKPLSMPWLILAVTIYNLHQCNNTYHLNLWFSVTGINRHWPRCKKNTLMCNASIYHYFVLNKLFFSLSYTDTYMLSKMRADYILTCTSVDDFLWIH